MLPHVLTQSVLVIGKEVALAANPLVVNFVNMSSEPLRAGRFVIAKDAEVRFDVGVEVTFEAPIIYSPPGAVGASVELLFLLLLTAGRGGGRSVTARLLMRCWGRYCRCRPD